MFYTIYFLVITFCISFEKDFIFLCRNLLMKKDIIKA